MADDSKRQVGKIKSVFLEAELANKNSTQMEISKVDKQQTDKPKTPSILNMEKKLKPVASNVTHKKTIKPLVVHPDRLLLPSPPPTPPLTPKSMTLPTPPSPRPPPPPQSAKPAVAGSFNKQTEKVKTPPPAPPKKLTFKYKPPAQPASNPAPQVQEITQAKLTASSIVIKRKQALKRRSNGGDRPLPDGEGEDGSIYVNSDLPKVDENGTYIDMCRDKQCHSDEDADEGPLQGHDYEDVYMNMSDTGTGSGAQNPQTWVRESSSPIPADDEDDGDFWEDSSFDECSSDEEQQRQEAPTEGGLYVNFSNRSWRGRSKDRQSSFINKAHQVVNELCTSERAYVSKLHLLYKLQPEVLEKHAAMSIFSDDVIKQMFPSIDSIYRFHSDVFLPKIEARLAEWENKRKIGDILKGISPFLKLYGEYISKVDKALASIIKFRERQPSFNNLLTSIEARPEFGDMAITHHMLEPIQRIPRYKLLLEQYVKHLPEDSDDLKDAKDSLQLISDIASSQNEALKIEEKAAELWEIANQLDGTVNLFDKPRDMIKKGFLWKLSSRHQNKHRRMILLFSDMLLVCAQIPLLWYEIRARFGFDDMEIRDLESPETEHGFVIKSTKRVIEFSCNSGEEETEWREKLHCAMKNYKENRVLVKEENASGNAEEKMVGEVAPALVPFQAVSKCMQCSEEFTFLVRKKHCYACGIVVCWKCCAKQAPLQYNNRQGRVCDQCFLDIRHDRKVSVSKRLSAESRQQVSADAPSVISGYVHMSENLKRTWQRYWLTLHPDSCLYIFRAHKDIGSTDIIHLNGECAVSSEKNIDKYSPHVLALTYAAEKTRYLKFNDETRLDKWLETLQQAIEGKLPKTVVNPHDSRYSTL